MLNKIRKHAFDDREDFTDDVWNELDNYYKRRLKNETNKRRN